MSTLEGKKLRESLAELRQKFLPTFMVCKNNFSFSRKKFLPAH